jgi:hypothetical protein
MQYPQKVSFGKKPNGNFQINPHAVFGQNIEVLGNLLGTQIVDVHFIPGENKMEALGIYLIDHCAAEKSFK